MQPPLTAKALADDLRVRAGDTLMVHASLRAIGPLQSGPDTLLDAVEDAVRGDGTF